MVVMFYSGVGRGGEVIVLSVDNGKKRVSGQWVGICTYNALVSTPRSNPAKCCEVNAYTVGCGTYHLCTKPHNKPKKNSVGNHIICIYLIIFY